MVREDAYIDTYGCVSSLVCVHLDRDRPYGCPSCPSSLSRVMSSLYRLFCWYVRTHVHPPTHPQVCVCIGVAAARGICGSSC